LSSPTPGNNVDLQVKKKKPKQPKKNQNNQSRHQLRPPTQRTVFEHGLLAVLAQEARELGLLLLHVVREVVLVAPLLVERPVRLLALAAAEVDGMAPRA
jgi:hypothetical protein